MSMSEIAQDCALLGRVSQDAYSHENCTTLSAMGDSIDTLFGVKKFESQVLTEQYLEGSAESRRNLMKPVLQNSIQIFGQFEKRKESGQELKYPGDDKSNQQQSLRKIHTGISALLWPARN